VPDNNLLKPEVETDPDPLRVSTFAEPEYGKVTFYFGFELASGGQWPIYCKKLTISIPTGRKSSALTGDPQLISYSASAVHGTDQGRKWNIERNTNDPNKVVFTCTPDTITPARFDGNWHVAFTLSGIEVNGAAGTVSMTIEEETSPQPKSGFQSRTGHAEIVKRDDSFEFHSFRPARTIVNRGSAVKLDWSGGNNATYTMYYRDKNGSDHAKTLTDPGGTWTLPEGLDDSTNFTLKATVGQKDYYQTTHVKIKDPDVTVNKLVTIDGATTYGSSFFYGTSFFFEEVYVESQKSLTVDGPIVANSTLSAAGNLTANGNLTVASGKTLTAHGPLTVGGNLTANGNVTVASGKTLTTNGPLIANNNLTVNGTTKTKDITVDNSRTLRVSTLRSADDGRDKFVRFGDDVTIFYGNKLTVEGLLDVYGLLYAKGDLRVRYGEESYDKISTVGSPGLTVHGGISAGGMIASGGNRVIRHDDFVSLRNDGNNGVLYRPGDDFDVHGGNARHALIYHNGASPTGNLRWKVEYRS
jgi:phage baseplate assembly protein gpV